MHLFIPAGSPNCPGTCAEQIANPANLAETVMLVNSIKVYQQSGVAVTVGTAVTNANLTGARGHVGRIGKGGAPANAGGKLASAAHWVVTVLPAVVAILAFA